MCEEFAGLGDQGLEKRVLGGREMNRFVAAPHQPAGQVHLQIVESEHGLLDAFGLRPAECCTEARQELLVASRQDARER